MTNICEMVHPHHPDCTCAICKAREDEHCTREARGTTEDGVRVCTPCGLGMEHEGFRVDWDNDYDPTQDREFMAEWGW